MSKEYLEPSRISMIELFRKNSQRLLVDNYFRKRSASQMFGWVLNTSLYVVRCAIWYHLYNLKNVEITRGGVLILVKLQAWAYATLLKLTLLHGCFSRFLNCTDGTKSRNAPHMLYQIKSLSFQD